MSSPGKQQGLRFFYRENTIEVQKKRHDNFSFKKAINMKNSVYGTMHFEGILKHPHKPNMILYERAPVKYHHFYFNRSSQDQPTHSSQISTARRGS